MLPVMKTHLKYMKRSSNQYLDGVLAIVKKIPREFWFIVCLFLITRSVLTFSGIFSRYIFSDTYNNWYEWRYDDRQWLDIWSVWDSGWYLDIAENGYSPVLNSDLPKKTVSGQSNIGFFPFYPILIKLTSYLTGDFHTSGILISNISLLVSGYFLYRVVSLDFKKDLAKRSVIFLFLFPTSFVLSGIFSESVFLLLSILIFYTAKKNMWFQSGILGLLLTITRPTGVLILVPIVYLYLVQNRFKINKSVLYFLFYPLGLMLFSVYLYLILGDFFAYFHSKTNYWGFVVSDPFSVIINFLTYSFNTAVIGVFIVLTLALIVFLFRKRYISYALFSLSIILIALLNGPESALGIPRMSCAVFPLYISLAMVSDNRVMRNIIPVASGVLQFVFMMFWSVGVLII